MRDEADRTDGVVSDASVLDAPAVAHVPSKRPAVPVAGPYGHPFHPIMVTVPIGSFVASLAFDVASRLGYLQPEGAAFAAAWLLVIGCVGAALAAVLGVMDLGTIPNGTPAARTAVTHGAINMTALVPLALSAGIRLTGDLDTVRNLPLALSVGGMVMIGVGGWLGGKLAYTYGVRVAREVRQDEGYRPTLS